MSNLYGGIAFGTDGPENVTCMRQVFPCGSGHSVSNTTVRVILPTTPTHVGSSKRIYSRKSPGTISAATV
jgi:hypothetical protein